MTPENDYPLHPSQKDVYMDQLINMESPRYNVGGYIVLTGGLDKAVLQEAIQSAGRVFDAFQLRFGHSGELVYRQDRACLKPELTETDFSAAADPRASALAWMQARFNIPIRLGAGTVPFEEYLVRISGTEHWFFGKYHHLVTDGYGFIVYVQYIAGKYKALTRGETFNPEYPSYHEEAQAASGYYHSSAYGQDERYWQEKLPVKPEKLLARKYQPQQQEQQQNASAPPGASYTQQLGVETVRQLAELQQNSGAGLQQLTIAALLIYFGRTTSSAELVFGIPVHKRNSRKLRNIVGMFSGILPFKGSYDGEQTLAGLLKSVTATQRGDYRHQQYQAGDLSRHLKINPAEEELFEVLVNYELFDFELDFGKAISAGTHRLLSDDERGPLQLSWQDYGKQQELQLQLQYRRAYFDEAGIRTFAERILYIMGQFAGALKENGTTGSIRILTEAEEDTLLNQFNDTATAWPENQDIINLFEEQVKQSPGKTAIICGDQEISYSELNERSNRLAHYLQARGVTAETLVPVCVERSVSMVTGILGILKAGAAYVPVDPEYPQERIRYMLDDTKAGLVLSSSKSRSKLTGGATVIELDTDWQEIGNADPSNPARKPRPQQLAYVIYTSGSTGKPKGVMITHGNLLNYCLTFKNYFSISSHDKVLQQSSISFDTMCEELYPALISGGTVIIVKDGGKDIATIRKYIENGEVSILSATPAVISWLNEELLPAANQLRYIISGGEVLLPQFINKLYPAIPIVNTYGPTETTVCVTYNTVQTLASAALIGKPVSNTRVYILNQELHLLPIGVPGEICIGGDQLALGYLNRPDLTSDKFVNNRFTAEKGKKIYKTGDLGRWLPDGNIEYLGRIDDQVKIRGYRIELGEIESILSQSGLVAQVVVLAKEDLQGAKRLVAYVVPDGAFDKEGLLQYLQSQLPGYMVPSLWVELPSLPLTPNGKIDKKALPNPAIEGAWDDDYVAPGNKTEFTLSAIWAKVLNIDRVGVNDNFFELGGHSILAMRVISLIRTELQAEIAIRDLFTYPTVGSLASHLALQNRTIPSQVTKITHRPAHIPLSFSQERLWFLDRLTGSVQYHLPAALRLKGDLDQTALAKTLRGIVGRHEALRTVISDDGGIGYQHILSADNWNLTVKDTDPSHEDRPWLDGYIHNLTSRPFDLSRDYMLRADLLKIGKGEYILVLTMHHIASDGWSVPILVNEFITLYEACTGNSEPNLPLLPLQYADYAIWQRNYLQGSVLDEKIGYWKSQLEGVTPLQLPADYSRPVIQSSHGSILDFEIDGALSAQLQALSHKHGATLYMTLLATFNVLLYRYSGQEDICVGTPVAGRPQQELEGMIGFFVNTLALRSRLSGEDTFTALLEQVKETTLEAYAHQDVPFEKVVEAVVKERDMSRNPLFQVMFGLQNTLEVPELKLKGLAVSIEENKHVTAHFDLSFSIEETSAGLLGSVEYNTDLYRAETVGRMITHYIKLLQSVINKPDEKLSCLSILDLAEEQTLLREFNGRITPGNISQNMVSLFQQQVSRTPDATALVFEGQQLTYQELNARSNQLARYLREKGVRAETLVPICIERGMLTIVGILGILKAGGAYVPIDPEYPQDRINYMLEDTAATLVISSGASRNKLQGSKVMIVELDNDWEAISSRASPNLENMPDARQLAYVIYTSGSTGRPKGVMVQHGAVASIAQAWIEAYRLTSFPVRLLQLASMSFDVFSGDLCRSLFTGGTMIICPDEVKFDFEALYNFVVSHKINIFESTPGLILPLMKYAQEQSLPVDFMKVLIIGSDSLNMQAYQNLCHQYGSGFRIINSYGTTETTIDSLYFEGEVESFVQNGVVPIGKPYSNTHVYILNKQMQVQPIGVAGELFIGGLGVSRGYLNRPELNAERFLENPFGAGELYRSGDLVRWLADGNMEYLGRIDDQVKIRGYRIELGEIETVLLGFAGVSGGIVLAKQNNSGDNYLVTYFVRETDFDISVQDLKTHLLSRLPAYMVPDIFIELEELPLTPNGKVDKKALPDPALADLQHNDKVLPQNPTEEKLAAIWRELLGIEQIGIDDNFFGLGGHSLLAMRVISLVRRELRVEAAIRDLFFYPTIRGLSAHLEAQNKGELLPSIIALPRPEDIPLSFSQERLWFIDTLEGSVQYHLPSILRLKGELNREALEKTLRYMVARHEVLRTVIREDTDGHGYQFILDPDGWSFGYLDGHTDNSGPAWIEQFTKELISRPFDLSKDYMLRADLIRLLPDEHLLVVTMHHIASDGWSTSVLVKEVVDLYASYAAGYEASLPALPLQYADYAIWQREYMQGAVLEEKLNYWRARLDGVSTLEMPTDYNRPAVLGTNGADIAIRIDNNLTTQLKALGQQQGATLYMTLLAAFNVLLYRYSGQEDICVGAPVAGRNQQEVEGLIGFFVNTLALRNQVSGQLPFTAFLHEVKTATLEAFAHQEVPFEKVVDAVVKDRDRSRNPLFQVMFVLQNTPEVPELKLEELNLFAENQEYITAKFDLTLTIRETVSGIEGSIEYNTDLYQSETIGRMIGHYTNLLGSIVNDPGETVLRLPMLGSSEQNTILHEFNDTEAAYPADKNIAALFEEQAAQHPEKTALIFEDRQLTYKELNESSNQLAHYLRKQGLAAGTLVPVCIERSLEMLTGILGILKAGGAYVPVDPDYPQDRIAYMLEDTKAGLVLSSKQSKTKQPTGTATVITLDGDDREAISREPKTNPVNQGKPADLAYVMYTSGSTGRPKGVMIEQQSVVSLVKGAGYVSATAQDTLLVTGSPSFDATTFEYWSMLLNGGRLVLSSLEDLLDSGKLQANIRKHEVTMMWFTSSWFNQLADNSPEVFEGLHTILAGGEKLSERHIHKIREYYPTIRLINGYGPTENTTFSLTYPITGQERTIPVGKPLNNRTAYILNTQYGLTPVGAGGEIYLGGAGVARGYLNNEELTKEKFIPNPFSEDESERLYKTGDLGRWTINGNIEYLGRIDDQVKIRGYRIELGEIESVISQSEQVSQAVVLAREDKQGTRRLVAYVVPRDTFDKQAIQSYLNTKLPDYMVPALWVALESFPLTSNGKVDKRALPDPELSDTNEYTAPRNETEQAIADIWQELLGTAQIGIHDNFFELGGDSILTIQVVSRLRRQGHVIRPKDIFTHQTIASLSAQIGRGQESHTSGEQGLLSGPAGLTPVQSWYLEKEQPAVSHFNQAVLLNLDKSITTPVLQKVAAELVSHHDALRFTYQQVNGQWQQEYGIAGGELITEEIKEEDDLKIQLKAIADKYQQSLSVEAGQLVKIVLIKTPQQEAGNRLLLVIHHLAVDGVSWRILLEDMEQLLNALMADNNITLGSKSSSYRQWYQALAAYGQSATLQQQQSYWEKTVKSYKPLPEDKTYTGRVPVKEMHDYQNRLGAEQTRRLVQEVPKIYHTEINDLLLAALDAALCSWSGRQEVVIGLEGHGREHISAEIDSSRTVGWFTSMYPVLLKGDKNPGRLIKGVKEDLRRVPDKGLGYGVLKYIEKTKALQGNEPWDILFNYLGQLDTAVSGSSWISAAAEDSGKSVGEDQETISKLSVNSHISGGELILRWSYSTRHYNEETITRLADDYISQLTKLIVHCLEEGQSGTVYTPSDYGLGAEVTYEELDRFLKEERDDNILSF